MTAEVERLAAREVRVGDRVLLDDGSELAVARIDPDILGIEGLLAFVEDSDARWLKMCWRADAEVEVIRAAG